MPIPIEAIPRSKKLPTVDTTLNSPSVKTFKMVLKRMIATASLTMPSPKIKLNNLGYSSYFIIEIAAMTSEEHKSEPTKKDSCNVKENCSYLLNKMIKE